MNWVEIFLGYSCNLKCSFCFQKDLRYKNPKFIEEIKVKQIIFEWYNSWKQNLIFSWGDPMLDPKLLVYVEYAKNLGYNDIRIHTNWLILSNKTIFEKYVKSWVSWFIISIHWYDKLHDILVKNDWAFKKVTKTLLNFVELKKKYPYLVLDTNTVLTKHNYKTLFKLFKFLSFFPITRSQLVQLYSLWLYSDDEKKSLYLKYEDFKDVLDDIVLNFWKNLTLENFPFCETSTKVHKNILQRQRYDNDAYWNIWENLEESSTTYIKKCEKCEFKNNCTGYPKDYLKIFNI